MGGHIIIIKGQIQEYVDNIGKTFCLPENSQGQFNLKGGYTVPVSQKVNVKRALTYLKMSYTVIDIGNDSITFIIDLHHN
jgi:hypothetical protein